MKCKLDGVRIFQPPTISEDYRGQYVEIWNDEVVPEIKFIQDCAATSRKNVLRGIHGDKNTWKLISCLFGAFYLVVVNFVDGSPQRLDWDSFTLSDRNHLQVLVPPGFGNGHMILTDEAVFHYKQSSRYDRSSQFTIAWNIAEWPIKNPILSERDSL